MPIINANLSEACNHDAVSCSTVVRWFKQFNEGRASVEDNGGIGRPCTSNSEVFLHFKLFQSLRLFVEQNDNSYKI